jgi:hypothetical protein
MKTLTSLAFEYATVDANDQRFKIIDKLLSKL